MLFYVNYFCNVYFKTFSIYYLQPQSQCSWRNYLYYLTEYLKLLQPYHLLLPFPIVYHYQQCQNTTNKPLIYKAKLISCLPNFRPTLVNLTQIIHLVSLAAIDLIPVFLGHHFLSPSQLHLSTYCWYNERFGAAAIK